MINAAATVGGAIAEAAGFGGGSNNQPRKGGKGKSAAQPKSWVATGVRMVTAGDGKKKYLAFDVDPSQRSKKPWDGSESLPAATLSQDASKDSEPRKARDPYLVSGATGCPGPSCRR